VSELGLLTAFVLLEQAAPSTVSTANVAPRGIRYFMNERSKIVLTRSA
jgi:hypothetical protein